MAFELPPLPYPLDALEPHIDARTMESLKLYVSFGADRRLT